jgi:hypothetical protein
MKRCLLRLNLEVCFFCFDNLLFIRPGPTCSTLLAELVRQQAFHIRAAWSIFDGDVPLAFLDGGARILIRILLLDAILKSLFLGKAIEVIHWSHGNDVGDSPMLIM